MKKREFRVNCGKSRFFCLKSVGLEITNGHKLLFGGENSY